MSTADHDDGPDDSVDDLLQRDDVAPTAIAVRLDDSVKTHELPSRSGGMRTLPIGTTTESVVGMDLTRKKCLIMNVGGQPAMLGERNIVDQGSGFTLPAGSSVTVEHCEQVWGKCTTTATSLSLLIENWADG